MTSGRGAGAHPARSPAAPGCFSRAPYLAEAGSLGPSRPALTPLLQQPDWSPALLLPAVTSHHRESTADLTQANEAPLRAPSRHSPVLSFQKSRPSPSSFWNALPARLLPMANFFCHISAKPHRGLLGPRLACLSCGARCSVMQTHPRLPQSPMHSPAWPCSCLHSHQPGSHREMG